VAELALGELITEKLPKDAMIGDIVRNQLICRPSVTRDPFRNRGRATDLTTSGNLFDDISLPILEADKDRFCEVPRCLRIPSLCSLAETSKKAFTEKLQTSSSRRRPPSLI